MANSQFPHRDSVPGPRLAGPALLFGLLLLVNLLFAAAGCEGCVEAPETRPHPTQDAGAGGQGGGDTDAGDGGGDAMVEDGGDGGQGDAGDGGQDGGDGGDGGLDDAGDGGLDDAGDGGLDDAGDGGLDDGGQDDGGLDGGIVGCALPCHGNNQNAAPPMGLGGVVGTTEPQVGAHQEHLAQSAWHHTVACTECHLVPPTPNFDPTFPTHMNGARDVTWGPIAKQGTFDFSVFTCTGTWCHGGTLKGDPPGKSTNRVPLWTKVDGTQAVCGSSCHATPPGDGHPQSDACPTCHGAVIMAFTPGAPPSATWVDKDLHVNGVVDVLGGGLTCTSCHGDPATQSPAPPVGTNGETQTTSAAVGAHQEHLGTTNWHRDVVCTDCHLVPTSTSHSNGVVDFSWGGPAAADGANPAFDAPSETCTGTYCHGTTLLPGGSIDTPKWTQVDGSQKACGTCHGTPPAAPHPQQTGCQTCHSAVIAGCPDTNPANCVFQPDVSATQSYKLHIDGVLQVSGGKCDSCHGAPPANGTHPVHAGGADIPDTYGSLLPRANATSYAYNCGYCHPLDPSKHMNGTLEVELYDSAAPPAPTLPTADGDRRSVKRENPAAAYLPGTTTYQGDVHTFTNGTCANVYCHSAEVPLTASVPMPANVPQASFAWQSVTPFYDVTQNVCCNGTADDYPNFTVNVVRRYASPSWVGTTYTGAQRCSHCHGYPPRASLPDNAGAGQGHAWMDGGWESGHFWNMGAGWPIQCRRCHTSTVAADLPPTGWHYAPLDDTIVFDQAMIITGFDTHVNGKKDVAFDLSPSGCGPASPDLDYVPWVGVPCLVTPTFDPATRRCNNVECHLAQTTVTWGAPYRAMAGPVECNACHQY